MRAPILIAPLVGLLASCTPDIVPGAYLCGPDAACPEDLVCSGESNTCVLPSQVKPFTCPVENTFEPDDTAAQARELAFGSCISGMTPVKNCLVEGDTADWVKFSIPSCTAVEVEVRISFPIAFQELGFELWDLGANMQLATDGECTQGAASADVRRCLDLEVAPGKDYGVRVAPTGEGTCDGDCTFNRYEMTIQLATPG